MDPDTNGGMSTTAVVVLLKCCFHIFASDNKVLIYLKGTLTHYICLQVLRRTTAYVKKSCIKPFVASEGVMSLGSVSVGTEGYEFENDKKSDGVEKERSKLTGAL